MGGKGSRRHVIGVADWFCRGCSGFADAVPFWHGSMNGSPAPMFELEIPHADWAEE
jgi:hypothetical protein